MMAVLANVKSHLANWREWEFNPIVIKELRQGVRSYTVTGMLLLFLAVLFAASVGFLITSTFDGQANLTLGSTMFSAFTMILAGASIFFIPLYTGVRVAAERQDNNPDLLYVSTLSPNRIILGKFLCSAYITLLFFSACMPFMAFTNLVRGIDLPTVFFVLAFLYLVVCAVNMAAIFLACLPVSRPFKILFVLYGLIQSFAIIGSLTAVSFTFMRSGVGAMMSHRDFWLATLTVVGAGVAVTGLFFVMSAALISPPSANRALPVRVYITVCWALSGAVALSWSFRDGSADSLLPWTVYTDLLMIPALLVVVSNSDELSRRVRRTIPRNVSKRCLAFLFYNGAAGGMVWAVAICLVTFAVTAGVEDNVLPRRIVSGTDVDKILPVVLIYAFAYGLTGLAIQRRFFPRRPAKLAGLLTVLLAAGWALIPGIFLFFTNHLSWRSVEGLQLGNIFNVMADRSDADMFAHGVFAGIWLLVAVLLNAAWFRRQFKNFVAPTEVPPPPIINQLPPATGS
jgi:ABC-type transport system involved in multi-copper enzyme maturation permease subunit